MNRIHAVGILIEKKQIKKRILFGRLEGSRITKRGFWVWFSDKSKKR